MKTKPKKLDLLMWIIILIPLLLGTVVVGNLLIAGYSTVKNFINDPVKQTYLTPINVARASEPTMKDWIRNEVEKAGLKWKDIECLIKNESNWDVWATNWNTNGTVDYGIFMINSVHKDTISVQERYDYKSATKWAINKRLNDGNYSAWYGYVKNCK